MDDAASGPAATGPAATGPAATGPAASGTGEPDDPADSSDPADTADDPDTGLTIRAGTPGDWAAVSPLLGFAFHHTPTDVERGLEGSLFEPARALLAEDAGTLVGHAVAYSRELSVPGGVRPAAHVSMVAVAPTHRRRGLLTRLMERQLTDIADAGREAVAVLWASEGRIYPRYGYGLAAQRLHLEAELGEVRLPDPPAAPTGRLRLADPPDALPAVTEVYERLRPDRPGWSSRDDRWWRWRIVDQESSRSGGTALRAAVYETPDGPAGYAFWRTRPGWTAGGPRAVVEVSEVVAAEPEAYLALWRLLLTVDLARTAHFPSAAPDDPLLHLVDEPRRLGARLLDSLWVRLVDLPAALAQRRYRTPVDVVLDVTDAQLPANTGRWRLTAGPDGATCAPATEPAALSCTVLELGAAYLGSTTLTALAGAGRVRELTAGKLAETSTAFGWHRAPAAIETF